MDGTHSIPEPRARPDAKARPLLARLWADEAAGGLARTRPSASAGSPLSTARLRACACGLAAAGACLIALPGLAAGPALAIATLFFATLIGLRITACLIAPPVLPRAALTDAELPRAAILIPAYREAAIMPHLVAGLAALDYPVDRLDIHLILEADDEETYFAALAQKLPAHISIIRVPPGLPRTKPRALNFALRLCDAEILTILDAEDRPAPGQLREAAERFAAAPDQLACLQAPLNWYNRHDSWVTRQFALEYAAHFRVMLPLYVRLGWPVPLGGTSNYFRVPALRDAGGWDAFNVTEDADLGFRLAARGLRCGLLEATTLEEAPIHIRPWIAQRTRWLKGYAQTFAVQVFCLHAEHWHRQLAALFLSIGAAFVSALCHGPLALISLVLLGANWTGSPAQLLASGFLVSGYAAAACCAAVGLRRCGWSLHWRDFLLMPVYWPLQTLAAVRALWQLAVNPYFWDKTEHGKSPAQSCISPYP